MQDHIPTPSEKTEKRRKFLINFAYFLLLFAISIFIVRFAIGALMPFIIAFAVTLVLRPVVKFFKTKLKIKSRLLEPAIVIVFYCTIGIIAIFLIIEIAKSLGDIISYLPSFYTNNIYPALSSAISSLNELLDKVNINYTLSATNILSSLGGVISSISSSLLSSAGNIALATPSFLISTIITIVATVFTLMDLELLTKFCQHQLSEERSLLLHNVLDRLKFVIRKYILSYAAIMFITFLEILLGLSILGISNAVLIAAIIAIFDILPVVGASLIILPWSAICFITGDIGLSIALIILLAILAVVRNIIEPKIVGSSVGIHPLLTLFAMLLGNFIYGPLGILLLPIGVALIQKLADDEVIHLYKPLPVEEEKQNPPSKLTAFISRTLGKLGSIILAPFKKLFKRKKASKSSEDHDKKGNKNE
jgi:sporulation integral membrane protein YtvI